MNVQQAEAPLQQLPEPSPEPGPPKTPLDRLFDQAHKSVADNPEMKLSEFLEWQDRRIHSGKWSASTDDETWNSHEQFDTPEEALAYGREVLAIDNGLEDGAVFYTGQIHAIGDNELAQVFDAERLIEAMWYHINDNVGECDDGIDATAEECAELERRVVPVVEQWLREFDLTPKMFRIAKIKSHVWYQCDVVDESQGGPSSSARCTLHKGHTEPEHDFP